MVMMVEGETHNPNPQAMAAKTVVHMKHPPHLLLPQIDQGVGQWLQVPGDLNRASFLGQTRWRTTASSSDKLEM